MRIEIRVKVYPISKEDHDRLAELVDELWAVESVFFDEYGNDNDIDYGVDEGIDGE